MKNVKKSLPIILGLLLVVMFSSCSNKEVIDACLDGHTFGFWGGLWHGIIAPVDFVLMFFRDDITIYAQNTNGAWYAFGFLLGSGGWGFLGGKGVCKKNK
ncbi:MAG: hypothetical protein A2W99_17645 [Bacteroidetes bacterium GWF2_33_16]|nr:MAG: hypothetical protein A2X00_14785 [Bacteroidetes bacterium GWE2_32_14]OFY06860.1 MAG: hypothetical protein A2W99_17645 [Bacteroidetes bacterium GWF2_33_16]